MWICAILEARATEGEVWPEKVNLAEYNPATFRENGIEMEMLITLSDELKMSVTL